MVLLTIIDGVLPQAQIALFSGKIVIQNIMLKFIMIICLSTGFLANLFKSGKTVWVRKITLPYVLFIMYLVVHTLVLLKKYSLDYLLFSYNAYYCYLILFPVACYVYIKKENFNNWILASSVPLMMLGFAQYLTQDTLLPLESADGYFNVFSWEYYDKVRSFSLFSSSMAYGHFLSLLGALVAFLVATKKGVVRFGAAVFFLAVSAACYTTMTRNVYLQFVFIILTTYLLTRWLRLGKSRSFPDKSLKFLPVFYGVVAAVAVYAGQLYSLASSGAAAIIKDDSLKARILEWSYYIPLWTGQGTEQFLFGAGMVPGSRIVASEEFVPDIDNSFLAVGVHAGLFGMVIWCYFMWRLWQWLLLNLKRYPDNGALFAITAFWSTWISSGLFYSGLSLYPMLAMIALPLCLYDKQMRGLGKAESGSQM